MAMSEGATGVEVPCSTAVICSPTIVPVAEDVEVDVEVDVDVAVALEPLLEPPPPPHADEPNITTAATSTIHNIDPFNRLLLSRRRPPTKFLRHTS